MVFDAADGYVVLLGGFGGSIGRLPTWIYSHGSWKELNIYGPKRIFDSTIAYDVADREVVLFGGHYLNLYKNTVYQTNDTWAFHGGKWTLLPGNQTNAPSPRGGAALAYDAADGYLLLFGGHAVILTYFGSVGITYGDTWKFSAGKWTHVVSSGNNPTGRGAGLMVYDGALREVVLIAGNFGGNGPDYRTWVYHAGQWTALSVAAPKGLVVNRVSSHSGACMAYDPRAGEVILFRSEGSAAAGHPYNQTWSFNGSWQALKLASTPPQYTLSACAYVPAIGGLLEFGDTFWTFVSSKWSPLPPARIPPSDPHPLLTYDTGDRYVLYYGPASHQSWSYANRSWTNITSQTATHPPAGSGASMTYDGADGYVLLFSGQPNQTWSFHGGNWANRTTAIAPSPRVDAALAFDSASAKVVLFGGSGCSLGSWIRGCQDYRDTWSYLHGNWSLVVPGSGAAPPGRYDAALVYDAGDGYLLLYGGTNCNFTARACAALNDTWNFNGGTWTRLGLLAVPSPRSGPSVTYDPHVGAVVLFGGCTVSVSGARSGAFSDTWTFAGGRWSPLALRGSSPPRARCDAGFASEPGGHDLLVSGLPIDDFWILRLS